jgi:hypothetical protein
MNGGCGSLSLTTPYNLETWIANDAVRVSPHPIVCGLVVVVLRIMQLPHLILRDSDFRLVAGCGER